MSEAGLEPALPFRGTSTSSWRVCPSTTRTWSVPGAPTPVRTGDLRITSAAHLPAELPGRDVPVVRNVAGMPGFEPRLRGPEPRGLPGYPTPHRVLRPPDVVAGAGFEPALSPLLGRDLLPGLGYPAGLSVTCAVRDLNPEPLD